MYQPAMKARMSELEQQKAEIDNKRACRSPQPNFDRDISEIVRLGGLFRLCRSIPYAFNKKRRFDNVLHGFRR